MTQAWMNRSVTILVSMMVVLLALLFISFVAAVYPYKPLRVDKIILSSHDVAKGDRVCFLFKGEKFYDMSANITVELVNGEAYHIMSYTSETPAGTMFKPRCFIIPQNIEPGQYQIRWTGVFYMNPFNYPKQRHMSEWINVRCK